MKVLLTQDVRKLGKAGEIVDVANGYARNYLIPQKLGVEASKAVLSEWESKKAAEQAHREREEAAAKAKAAEINGRGIILKCKAGENGKLFGSVTAQAVADAINEQIGLNIDKKKVVFPDDIKTVGDYTITVRLMAAAEANLHMTVEKDA